MSEEQLPWFFVAALFVMMILLSISSCQTMKSRESDWRRWTEEAEELGYYRGYEDGYAAAEEDFSNVESEDYWRGVEDGYAEGYQDGHYTGTHGMD